MSNELDKSYRGFLFLQDTVDDGYVLMIKASAKKGHLVQRYDEIIAYLLKERETMSYIKGEGGDGKNRPFVKTP